MNTKQPRGAKILLLPLFFALFCSATFLPLPVRAEAAPAAAETSDTSTRSIISPDAPNMKLVLSPSTIDIYADHDIILQPDTTYENENYTSFIIANSGQKDLTVDLAVKPYYISSTTYEGNITNDANAHTELSKWIKFDNAHYTLASGERKTIPFSIQVPKDAAGGGQYAIIYITASVQADSASSVQAENQLGLPIFSRVNGETREEFAVTSQNISGFLLAPPITATSTINNTGNVDIIAEYHMVVQNIFGKTVYDYTKEGHILPDAPRNMELAWDDTPTFGIFKVQQQIKVAGETVANLEKTVIVTPIWIILAVFVLLAGFVAVKVKKHQDRHKLRR